MGIKGKLKGVEDQLTKDLEKTIVSFRRLAEKYGVTHQAIFNFCQKKRIKRAKRRQVEHAEYCPVCRSLIRISKQHRSEFLSSQALREELGLNKNGWFYHMGILRRRRLIPEKFGRMYSKKLGLAFQIYFNERLPTSTIGKRAGLRSFHAVLQHYKALGWDVPDPLFAYDGEARRARLKGAKKKRRSSF